MERISIRLDHRKPLVTRLRSTKYSASSASSEAAAPNTTSNPPCSSSEWSARRTGDEVGMVVRRLNKYGNKHNTEQNNIIGRICSAPRYKLHVEKANCLFLWRMMHFSIRVIISCTVVEL